MIFIRGFHSHLGSIVPTRCEFSPRFFFSSSSRGRASRLRVSSFVYPAEPLLAFAACSSFSWLNSSGALHFTQDLAFFLLVS
jgi:hypothetical protein